jgi:hypothetical protein
MSIASEVSDDDGRLAQVFFRKGPAAKKREIIDGRREPDLPFLIGSDKGGHPGPKPGGILS